MVLTDKLKRPSALAVAALLLLASAVPLLSNQKASAYGLLASRQIRMSSSASGSVTAGQGVTYQVNFNVASDTQDIGGVVVDFCSNSPIIGDACTAPTGLDVDSATLTLNSGLTSFTKDATETVTNKFVLSNASAYNPGVAQSISFDLVGVTNPTNVNTTFYARIVTFTTQAGVNAYDSATANVNNPGAEPPVIDAGGIALSTAEQITVTAKVQERLTFCVYTDGNNDTTLGDANTTSCTGVAGSAITLGDSNGVLYDTGPFVNKDAMFNVSTNASSGAVIQAKASSSNANGSLASGATFFISPAGGGTAEANSAPGTEQYGFCLHEETATGLVVDTDYDGDNATGEDCADSTDTAGTGATGGTGAGNDVAFAFITAQLSSTYGSPVATKAAGAQSTGRLAFLGNIATTTEPGIYTSTMAFIATGTY